uniref:Cell differentiation protein rcd1 n=1 Tax=Zea mays TaxID=4577 RepID=A0A804P7H5_MAIZE
MENPPPSSAGPYSAPAPAAQHQDAAKEDQDVAQLVLNLCIPELREKAIIILSKREKCEDLALLLWHSFGTMAALLQEIVSIYRLLSPPQLSFDQSTRVCNVLVLLKCVASHPDTRMPFLNAQFPLYLYPFLNTTYKTREYEFLRISSLSVIGALVKSDDHEVIVNLLCSEIVPLCLRAIEMGSELSKKMVEALAEQPSPRTLKNTIRCYLRLTDDRRACQALRDYLPIALRDGTFNGLIEVDLTARLWLHQLLHNVMMSDSGGGPRPAPGPVMGM